MKNAIVAMCLTAALVGCAAGPSPQLQAYNQFIVKSKPLAEAGTMKWSDYYAGLYSLSLGANLLPSLSLNFSRMIDFSINYEAGAMSKDEFFTKRRESQIAGQADIQAAQQEQERAKRERASLVLAYLAAHPVAPVVAPPPMPSFQPVQQVQITQPPIIASMGFLQTQSVNGMLRYCKYSNGVVNTISSVALCPINTTQ